MGDASRLLSTFLDLVALDSPSFHERDVADYIGQRFFSIGARVRVDDSAARTGSNTGNLLCGLDGDERTLRLLFAAHMDTVEPGRGIAAKVEGDVIRSEGETILGADDKAGIAVSIELAERIVENHVAHGPIEFVFTVAEEKGLVGAKNLDVAAFKRPHYAYVLDAEGPPGEIIIGAPFYDSLEAVFVGKAAHAGVEPEEGANALTAAAQAISEVKVGRIDKETTANIGTITGGRERNIVPDRVEITGEVRSHSLERLKAQVETMTSVLKGVQGDGVRVDVSATREFDGFHFAPDLPIAQLAADGLMAAGLVPHFRVSGGGSDANILNAAGIPTVALSVGYNKAHATDEHVHLSDLAKSVAHLLEMVRIAASRVSEEQE